VETLLALNFVERGRWRINIEQSHVRFAIFADAVCEGLQTPIFVFRHFTAHLPDDAGQLGCQFLDLLRAQVLARKVDVFVQRHECLSLVFKSSVLDPGAKPLEPLECSEGGSTGRRAKWPYRMIKSTTGRPFSSQPGSTERAVYKGFSKKRKANQGGPL
jgi:hypothetical protein